MGPQKSNSKTEEFNFFLAFCAANLQFCTEIKPKKSQK